MHLEVWLAFAVAAGIILVIPGPTIILVVSQAIVHGRGAVLPLVAGVALGDFTAITLSLCGLGAVLSASATLFFFLKWIGALYLLYLGIKMWRTDPANAVRRFSTVAASGRMLFKRAFLVTASNPKSIAFFVAFLPQFIHPGHPPLRQFLILGATFLILASVNAALYALFAGQLRETLQSSKAIRWFNRCGGSALIGAGVITATLQKSS